MVWKASHELYESWKKNDFYLKVWNVISKLFWKNISGLFLGLFFGLQ